MPQLQRFRAMAVRREILSYETETDTSKARFGIQPEKEAVDQFVKDNTRDEQQEKQHSSLPRKSESRLPNQVKRETRKHGCNTHNLQCQLIRGQYINGLFFLRAEIGRASCRERV